MDSGFLKFEGVRISTTLFDLLFEGKSLDSSLSSVVLGCKWKKDSFEPEDDLGSG